MSLISIFVFVMVLLSSTAHIQSQKASSVQNFRDYVSTMIKEQSTKIQSLLKKIQNNAQSVLSKIENMSTHRRKLDLKKKKTNENGQIESPLKTGLELDARSYSNHYQATGYGASGNANYGMPTYHHHSIGFDPINIMVSVSLLSFLLQALQGLLTRTRLPTPVVEAKSLNAIEEWTKTFEDKLAKDKYYIKKFY